MIVIATLAQHQSYFMKKTLLLALFAAGALLGQSQNKRYYDKIFNDVQIQSDQVYGNNYVFDFTKGQFGLTAEDQTLDIYLPPAEDTATNRPLIVWAHGGSFLGGTKMDKDIVYFCNEYAKRGFVCVSINYRIGYELPLDSVKAFRTVFRALQDGRAAVRYMRSRADELKIDKNRVYFGGTSAGAFIALNVAYLNLPEEVPSFVDTSAHDAINMDPQIGIDGIEGKTNTIQESSEIMGIINYCGATRYTSWIDDQYSRNIPLISMHGTRDSTVPYGTRVIYLNDLTPIPPQVPLPIIQVQGSYDINKHNDASGYSSKFYTWYNADHVPYINYDDNGNGAAYMDTLMKFTVKFVYEDFLKLGEVDGIGENDPPCDFNNGNESPCAISSVSENYGSLGSLFPNPTDGSFMISNYVGKTRVTISDLTGKEISQIEVAANEIVTTTHLSTGVYLVKLENAEGTRIERLSIQR